jgi:hypothetical protein
MMFMAEGLLWVRYICNRDLEDLDSGFSLLQSGYAVLLNLI